MRYREIRDEAICLALVEAFVNAAVASDDDVRCLVGVDPYRMIVYVLVALSHAMKSLPTVFSDLKNWLYRIDAVDILRVREDLVVVVTAGLISTHLLPARTAVA